MKRVDLPTTEPRTVTTRIHVPTPPERAVAAFLDAENLAGWWRVSRSFVDPRVDGVWSVAWDDHGEARTNHVWAGSILVVEARRLVVGRLVMVEPNRPLFAPLRLEVVAEPEGDGAGLTVHHHGYGRGEHWDWAHDVVVAGWAHVLDDLRDWFAGAGGAR